MPCASSEEAEAAIAATELFGWTILREDSRFWTGVEPIGPGATATPLQTCEVFVEAPHELLP